MKLRILLLVLPAIHLILSTYSCIQPEDNPFRPEFIVKGRLVESCDSLKPLPDKLVILETDHNRKLFCKHDYKLVSLDYTDNDGFFELKYKRQDCIDPLKVAMTDPAQNFTLVTYLNGNKNIELGDVHLHPKVIYEYVIKTGKPFTSSDTLFYDIQRQNGGDDSTYQAISGPFSNKQTLTTFSHSSQRQIHDKEYALENDRFDYEYLWFFKTADGKGNKRYYEKIIFTNCQVYTITNPLCDLS